MLLVGAAVLLRGIYVLFDHLLRLEKEQDELKRVVLKSHDPTLANRDPGSLRGIGQGMVIEEKDFAEAKASLFPTFVQHFS